MRRAHISSRSSWRRVSAPNLGLDGLTLDQSTDSWEDSGVQGRFGRLLPAASILDEHPLETNS